MGITLYIILHFTNVAAEFVLVFFPVIIFFVIKWLIKGFTNHQTKADRELQEKCKILFHQGGLMKVVRGILSILILAAVVGGCGQVRHSTDYFEIHVVDDETGREVPLVELKTVNDIRYYTDSNGMIAFYEPGLMGREVFFHIESHGYQVPLDFLGYRGVRLKTRPGGSATVEVNRVNIAERLYRVTGQGIYRDSVLLGLEPPLREPVLNGDVLGQDTVMAAVYRGKVYWFWGDTDRASYPLGHFATAGATSQLPDKGGLAPGVGVDLEYFVDADGFSKPMAPLEGEGMIWIDGVLTLADEAGETRLLAHYNRMAGLDDRLEHGLLVFNDEKEEFEKLVEFANDARLAPGGHPLKVAVEGEDYFYFACSPYPLVRVKAKWGHVTDLSKYEAFTCLKAGSGYDRQAPALDRDEAGKLRWGWKRDTAAVDVQEHAELIEDGAMGADEAWLELRDIETGQAVRAHGGSVHWNDYIGKYVMIVEQSGGDSNIGEIWYSCADAPQGPWRRARKIVTHKAYSFYNPTQHPFFDEAGGRIIYFEGTYTASFSAAAFSTPRYDYNQIMYRLDLSDTRLQFGE
jgi:hypothetical protein